MSVVLNKIVNLNYKVHLSLALTARLVFITYAIYHDEISTVPYTDVDYNVFTDAARHVLNRRSPYDRHTYRYSPLIAFLLTFNITVHYTFGKILFSLMDLLVGLLIRSIVLNSVKEYEIHTKKSVKLAGIEKSLCIAPGKLKMTQKRSKHYNNKFIKTAVNKQNLKPANEIIADSSMLLWLYNPMAIAIATRGNCDSIAGFLVLTVLYYLQCKKSAFIAGILHGFAIHIRLYPVIYSLALFMYLSNFSYYGNRDGKKHQKKDLQNQKHIKNIENKIVQTADVSKDNIVIQNSSFTKERKTIFKKKYLLYLLPNSQQLLLIGGTFLSLLLLTGIFYYSYGYKFLYETYLYHLIRQDARHNFSFYFYLQYLTAGIKNIGIWQKVLVVLPKSVLLLVLSIKYGLNKYALNFCILTLTTVMVIYNTVLTSQYFVWIWAILPVCVWQVKMTFKEAVFLLTIWFAAQIAWLLPAYFLEFQGQNTFLLIWIQSVSFFCANVAILGRMIKYFSTVDYHEKEL